MADTRTPPPLPPPQKLEERILKLLGVAEEARQQSLKRLAEDAGAEQTTLLRIRDQLKAKLEPDDPRLAALERRLQGSRGTIDFARGGERSGAGTSPGEPTTSAAGKKKQIVKRSTKPENEPRAKRPPRRRS